MIQVLCSHRSMGREEERFSFLYESIQGYISDVLVFLKHYRSPPNLWLMLTDIDPRIEKDCPVLDKTYSLRIKQGVTVLCHVMVRTNDEQAKALGIGINSNYILCHPDWIAEINEEI